MGDFNVLQEDFVQLARLAVNGQWDDVRLFVARLIRKYRNKNPELVAQLNAFLRTRPAGRSSMLRHAESVPSAPDIVGALPVDQDSRLSLLKVFEEQEGVEEPLFSKRVHDVLAQLVNERKHAERLRNQGLPPTKSAIFLGPPGVGKTLTARWIATQLGMPFFVLDLTTVMSSFLGKSGNNLRIAIDYAKTNRCVLLLDEIDAIAKRRSDESDVGELKRLVTVMLQEVEDWPDTGLLLAATNHPELIDRALWRRFDLIVEFDLPDIDAIRASIKRFLGPAYPRFEQWLDILTYCFEGHSYSHIEKTIQRFRRNLALNISSEREILEEYVASQAQYLPQKKDRIELAAQLTEKTKFSQHAISEITGVSRDTIRKYGGKIAKGVA